MSGHWWQNRKVMPNTLLNASWTTTRHCKIISQLVPIRGTKGHYYFLKASHVYFPELFAGHLYLVSFYVKFTFNEDYPVRKMFRFMAFLQVIKLYRTPVYIVVIVFFNCCCCCMQYYQYFRLQLIAKSIIYFCYHVHHLSSEAVILIQIVIRIHGCVAFFYVCAGLQFTLFYAWESTGKALTHLEADRYLHIYTRWTLRLLQAQVNLLSIVPQAYHSLVCTKSLLSCGGGTCGQETKLRHQTTLC